MMKPFSRFCVAIIVLGIGFAVAGHAYAATLSLIPSSGVYAGTGTFTTDVYVNTGGVAANAFSGTISFPKNLLQVVSISKTGSLVNLWVQEPLFSNADGVVSFEGLVFNPGYAGLHGKVLTITFSGETDGLAHVVFTNGSVLANDGVGTELLSSMLGAVYDLQVNRVITPAAESDTNGATGTPQAPRIMSVTHPDSHRWYANDDPEFSWSLSQSVTQVRASYSRESNGVPTTVYDPAIARKTFQNVADGVWYFHVQLRSALGWGGVSHFQFRIDTVPPDPFSITIQSPMDPTDPRRTVELDARDAISGIARYVFLVDSKDISSGVSRDAKTGLFTLPPQGPGKHRLTIQAFDGANNVTAATTEFSITPIDLPVITSYTQSVGDRTAFTVSGTSYPNATLLIWIQQTNAEAKQYTTVADSEGKFVFGTGTDLHGGGYQFWVVAQDVRGAQSMPTERRSFVVAESWFSQSFSGLIGALSVVIPFVALTMLFGFVVWYGIYWLNRCRKYVLHGAARVDTALHREVLSLQHDMRERLQVFDEARDQRDLTPEEEEVSVYFAKRLVDLEKIVSAEIRNIDPDARGELDAKTSWCIRIIRRIFPWVS